MTLEDFEPYEVFTKEIQEIVDRTLDALPEQTRKIFVMSRNENKSHKEIAELLDITTKGVEFHISKATRTLRLALKDYLPVSLLFSICIKKTVFTRECSFPSAITINT